MTTTPAGWYPDPENAGQSRWWDGAQWTEHRSAPPSTMPYSTQAAALRAPEGTPWNTVWIWLTIFLPYVPFLGFFTIDWPGLFGLSGSPGMSSLAILASPGYLFSLLGSWVVIGLVAWIAHTDWRELKRRGVPKPFHWAWGFLSMVYPIGRSVVVRRRTGKGISPMWVTIVTYVVVVLVSFVLFGILMSAIFSQIASNAPGLYYP